MRGCTKVILIYHLFMFVCDSVCNLTLKISPNPMAFDYSELVFSYFGCIYLSMIASQHSAAVLCRLYLMLLLSFIQQKQCNIFLMLRIRWAWENKYMESLKCASTICHVPHICELGHKATHCTHCLWEFRFQLKFPPMKNLTPI